MADDPIHPLFTASKCCPTVQTQLLEFHTRRCCDAYTGIRTAHAIADLAVIYAAAVAGPSDPERFIREITYLAAFRYHAAEHPPVPDHLPADFDD